MFYGPCNFHNLFINLIAVIYFCLAIRTVMTLSVKRNISQSHVSTVSICFCVDYI